MTRGLIALAVLIQIVACNSEWLRETSSSIDRYPFIRFAIDDCSLDNCNPSDYKSCVDNVCTHKDLFPQKGMEILGLITLALMMCLSTMGGIGGGGVVVPLLQTFFNFELTEATTLSGFSIVMCQTVRFLYNIN